MSDIMISVENLSKQYTIGHQQEGYSTLRDTLTKSIKGMCNLLRQNKMERETIWALKNINFELKQGELLGIIGRNGAGKTTLLKILSRITNPTEGRGRLRGRVGSLLEVGTGFHPELTGRENIYLNGAILGMKKAEIEHKFDEIVAFAEMERFIDTQVKFYSSGMYMRLAFSVAAHLEPDILLVDEVLAVGDAVFQTKCLAQMGEIHRQGKTILFVSHNMNVLGSVCQRGIVLGDGRVVFDGRIQDAINFYERDIFQNKYIHNSIRERTDRSGTGDVRFVSFHSEDEAGRKIERIPNGSTIKLVFGYETKDGPEVKNIELAILVETSSGERALQFGTRFTGQNFRRVPPKGYITCTIRRFPLVPGRYNIASYLVCESREADFIASLTYLDVVDGDFFGSGYEVHENESKFLVDGTWSCVPCG
jgi:lipopolysaccharide transport system ATP-binding protein